MVLETKAHKLVVDAAGTLVATSAIATLGLNETVVVRVCSEMTDPVTLAVAGTVTVAVRMAGVEEADAVTAAEVQVSC